jgi:hypothetical protein
MISDPPQILTADCQSDAKAFGSFVDPHLRGNLGDRGAIWEATLERMRIHLFIKTYDSINKIINQDSYCLAANTWFGGNYSPVPDRIFHFGKFPDLVLKIVS